MSHQGTMLSTIVCLLPLFSHLQPATGETTELLQSVGSRTQKENYDEIVCTFNVKVSLSRVDFVDKTGSEVFAIVDCGTSCNVLSSYQDVLRIVSPEKTISGDRFVFNASHSDRTNGTYTCHGITAPQVVYPTPSGTGDGDGHGDGYSDESQMTSGSPPETDEVSHNAGGGSNGLLALIIIPILLVLGAVLFLHWCGVIQIPGLPKTRGEPRDLRHIQGNRLQPVTGCWERTRGLWQSTGEDNEDPFERLESNREQDEEACVEAKELLGHNEEKLSLHQDKKSFEAEGNDGSKEEHPLLQDVCNNTKHTQDDNASVGDSQTSLQSLHRESNNDQDEEASLEAEALLSQNEDKMSLHLGVAPGKLKSDLSYPTEESFESDRNYECKDNEMSDVKEEYPLLRDSYNNTKPTQDENASVEDRQTSPQSLHLSNSIKATDVAADLSATSLSRDNIQHKEESPHTTSHSSAPDDTVALTLKPAIATNPPHLKLDSRVVRNDSRPLPGSSVIDNKESENDNKIDHPSPTFIPYPLDEEGKDNSVRTLKDVRNYWKNYQHRPPTASAMSEEMQEEMKKIKAQFAARTKKGMEGTEERKDDIAGINVKGKENSKADSEAITNEDTKGKLTHKNKEDMDGKKEREDEKANVEMEEKEIMEIKLGTEEKSIQKQEQIEETMAAKVEQEDKEESKREEEHAQEMEAEAVTEKTADTRAETFKTSKEPEKKVSNENDDYKTAFDDDDADRSRNDEGVVDVDKLDGARSTGQSLVYTDLSNPEHSQECSEGEKKQTISSRLNDSPNTLRKDEDDNSPDV
ncbi:protein IWS1 homolog isoform X2 [Pomacea canaliculata]|uniref:protein IWS1 homolog isoform X2 n=1 Tax=Pomacea canaliculata TaxID=400727 RepID=UPI000D72675E|nr:protein IWS1 homolog isoform X2 [Pomacea canaliculata]